MPIPAGDSLCADAEVVTAGAHPGARGKMALWLLGKSKDQVSFVDFGRLPAKSHWTAVSTCVTAKGSHSGLRVQFYDAPKAPALAIDAVDVHQSFVEDGGFNNMACWMAQGGCHRFRDRAGRETGRRRPTRAATSRPLRPRSPVAASIRQFHCR